MQANRIFYGKEKPTNAVAGDCWFRDNELMILKDNWEASVNNLKSPKVIGEIEIDLEQHDVLLTARGSRPPLLMIDGIMLGGVSKVIIINELSESCAIVSLNEYIKENLFPFDDFESLQRLFQKGHQKLSVRELCLEKRLGEHSYQDHRKSCDE
ncbi:TPA: hypothetical protein SUY24_001569 [Streptococcus equi subsp. equi]|uniref:hypothetical protein n=1 Tax=Streptococcus equi TaxID=1336 RepID=UPI00067B179B|nr:hypothetical protein [Streptococcus equi]HEL0710535.1 hypothetical protein [Streptococcus equi subsp. zooepidemicus]MBT1202439.1 hypothetical protein [Streptococcus equi subsp. equi]MBT1204132.1 hypothetical protein [Streptococcus equi subsp. equi]MBT1204147.1 hypothetical protein [Streptococcus equi subsp. equi]MBT1204164.1 hypothetical protein [Streptococcus equi subsp. equi]